MSKESLEAFEETWINVCKQFNVNPKTGEKMNSKKEISNYTEKSNNTCKLFDNSEIDFQEINNELIRKQQWFEEKSNRNMLNSIQDIINEYQNLIRYYNCATEKLFNISNNIIILEKYKNDNKISELPSYYAFGFILSNEYDLEKHEKYPSRFNDINDELKEELYNKKEFCCGLELSKREADTRNKIIENQSEKFTQIYETVSISESLFSNFSKNDLEQFITSQINNLKIIFKYQKNECEKLKKMLDKYRDSVVSISDDYEKLIGFLKSTNSNIKQLLIKNDSNEEEY